MLPLPLPDWSKPIILLLLVLAAGLAIRSRLATVRGRRLEAQRTELVHDVDALQVALVPDVPSQLGGLALSVAYSPADGPAAGGDFYDVFPVGPDKVAILLGDASGHGREALARAARMRFTLRAYVEAGLEPRAALDLAGRVTADEPGEAFTTVVLGVYDSDAGILTYAAAGHPPPIVLGPGADEPVTACSSPPIGWSIPTGRRQSTVALTAGARVCFFSDGLTESCSEGQMLGRDGLTELLHQLGPSPSAVALLERVRASADGAPDDMAACIIVPGPPHSSARLRIEQLELDADQLHGTQPARFLAACGAREAEIERAVALARVLAEDSERVLLRVRTQPSPVHVTVTATERPEPLSARGFQSAPSAVAGA